MILGYIRVSTDKQTVENQRFEILKYAQTNNLKIDEFIEIEISSQKSLTDRKIDELILRVQKDDTLIISELSRVARSLTQILDIVNQLNLKGVNLISIKEGISLTPLNSSNMQSKIMITMFGLLGELERDLISQRVKEALASKKARGIKLGKPKGTIQKSIFDKDKDRIFHLLEVGVSMNKIINMHLKYGTVKGLSNYINKIKRHS